MALCLSSCVQRSRHNEVLQQRDTLMARNAKNETMLTELQTYLDEITLSLDSIAYQESILFLPSPEAPDKVVSRKTIEIRLKALQELVDRQQLKIRLLSDSLNVSNTNLYSVKSLLTHMQGQIEQKNVQIEQMKRELRSKDANIGKLKSTVASLESDVNDLKQQTKEQEDILIAQNDLMNEACFIMGSRKELVAWGALKGGKVSPNPNLDNFNKVDIRYFTELELPGARPKILTQMPAASYTLVSNGDGTSSLYITDPAEFWKVSKILIIQLR